uniref:Uncharacterized protein n=1 Tax=Anthurium amnicola TaxID=1678845 RepID=A0A1D1Y1I9_9ARAE
MNTKQAYVIFKILRAIEILVVFICFVLEMVEYAAFLLFHADQGFPESSYFNAAINKSTIDENVVYYNGTKVFFYIVLLLTLADSGFYLSRYCRYYVGPFKRDISINAFFMMLWLVSGITNIYPVFNGYGFTCQNLLVIGGENAKPVIPNAVTRECNAKTMIISFNWINTFLFFVTTLIALKLWRERQIERFEGERRVEALGEVVYKYRPRPNTIVQVNEPEQVMIFKSEKRNTPTYVIKTSNNLI